MPLCVVSSRIHCDLQVSNCPFNTGNGYGDGRAIRYQQAAFAATTQAFPDA
jgi:hypothetical protein